MNGAFERKTLEEHQARILEASGYAGPVGAGLVGAAEKSRAMMQAAEQRRLLVEAGIVEPRLDRPGLFARASAQIRLLVARTIASHPGGDSTVSSPDHA